MDIAKVIIEAGARYDIKDEHGKTAFDWIENKGTKERYDKIVEDYKLSLEYKPGSKKDTRNKIIGYLLPFILYPTFLILIGKFYWFISVPIILVIFYGLSLIIKKVLSKGGRDKMESNPFVASLYQSTLFYLFLNYIFVFFQKYQRTYICSYIIYYYFLYFSTFIFFMFIP